MKSKPDGVEFAARVLVAGIREYHAKLWASGDEEARAAVIVKSVALLVLAFGMPTRDGDEEADQEEALERLTVALGILDACEKRSASETSDRKRVN